MPGIGIGGSCRVQRAVVYQRRRLERVCVLVSGTAGFVGVAGTAARGLYAGIYVAWVVVCEIRIVGIVQFSLVMRIKSLRSPNRSGLRPEIYD